MMLLFQSLLVVLQLIPLFVSATSSFQLLLVPHARDCFYENLKVGEKLDLSFEVYDGANLDIDFWVTAPNDQIIYSVFKQSTGTIAFNADKEGIYTYCFSNQMSTVSHKTLTFTVHGPDEKVNYVDKYKGQSDENFHSPLNEEIARLAEAINMIQDEQMYFRDRLDRHRLTANSTNSRVAWWSVFQCFVLGAVCLFQIFYITRFFNTSPSRFV